MPQMSLYFSKEKKWAEPWKYENRPTNVKISTTKNNVQICFLASPIFVFYVDKNNNNYAQWHMHGWINQGINLTQFFEMDRRRKRYISSWDSGLESSLLGHIFWGFLCPWDNNLHVPISREQTGL